MGITSCSVEKNTSLSRNYHNLVSHYNIYFNGKEAYQKGLEKAEDNVRYNYSQILPLFLYEDEAVNSSVTTDMKRAIDKATKVITFHSITSKPKVKEGDQSPKDKAFYEKIEYNKWVDDSYMLMGKSYMYQGEFFLAVETFKHVIQTFPAEDVRFLGMMWLTRAYLMIGEEREAERILMALSDYSELPDEYQEVYHSTWAQFEMNRDKHGASAQYLELALRDKGLSKEEKVRYTYILGQLYEEAGDNDQALERYRQVTRYNPPYEMAFNAKVSMAEVFEAGSASSEELKKLLNKMLKDSKNKEYLDQIYYALGNIAAEEGNQEKAIEYYQLSVSSSVQNNFQKGLSSVTLAEIFYEQPVYLMSAAYYDSAVQFLNSEYPGYRTLQSRASSLGDLVYYTNSFELEDSVQVLASLPEDEMYAVIDELIAEVRKAEEDARLAEQQAMQDMAFNQTMLNSGMGTNTTTTPGGKWYFYNLNAKSFGQPEFRMKWGDRKLEDNWRRSNKASMAELGGDVAEGDSATTGSVPLFDNKSREFYLATIPLTDSAMEVSNQNLEIALYHMGKIYKDDLQDFDQAISCFEDLVQRNPQSPYAAESCYYLYELYGFKQNVSLADSYKRLLASKHADSHWNKLLTNPNYLKELEEAEMKVTRIYEGVYEQYLARDYQGVILDADSALALYPEDALAPKFMYIRALSVGSLEGKEAMKVGLDSLIASYPGTEESVKAQEIIDYMFESFPVIREAEEAKVAEAVYEFYLPDDEHYLLLALDGQEDLNLVSFNLLNFNLDNYNEYDLNIEKVKLNDGYGMLMVSAFLNEEGARRYLESVEAQLDLIMGEVDPSRYKLMLISKRNMVKFNQEKQHNPYYLFYLKHYLNPE